MVKNFTKKIMASAFAAICVLSIFTTTATAETNQQEIGDVITGISVVNNTSVNNSISAYDETSYQEIYLRLRNSNY